MNHPYGLNLWTTIMDLILWYAYEPNPNMIETLFLA